MSPRLARTGLLCGPCPSSPSPLQRPSTWAMGLALLTCSAVPCVRLLFLRRVALWAASPKAALSTPPYPAATSGVPCVPSRPVLPSFIHPRRLRPPATSHATATRGHACSGAAPPTTAPLRCALPSSSRGSVRPSHARATSLRVGWLLRAALSARACTSRPVWYCVESSESRERLRVRAAGPDTITSQLLLYVFI